jgi:stage V sporulation protein B
MIRTSTVEDSGPEAPRDDIARVAGRGTIFITAAKVWFIVTGYGIYFALPRLLSVEQWGLYVVVIGAVSVLNAVIVTGTYQTVSKYVSQEEGKADSVKAAALRLQLLVGGGASLGFFLLASVIAGYLNDQRLTAYLRLASLITLSYSFYSVFTGYFNGRRKFLAQAGLDAAYSTLKVVFIVLFVWLGYGVMGAVAGFALAAASVLVLSAIVAGKRSLKGVVRQGDLFRFQAYLLVSTLVINLLQRADLFLIKARSASDATTASGNAGYYAAATALAAVTYQIIISVTFVIFPLVSQATFAGDRAKTRIYISSTMRYTLMIMALVATLLSANAAEVLHVVYTDDYQVGATALSVVAYGMLLFGLLYVLTTIISASGRPGVSLVIGTFTLAASGVLNFVLIPGYGLTGAAVGTTAAMFLGAVVSGGYVKRTLGAFLPWVSAFRIGGCALGVFVVSKLLVPGSRLLIVFQLAAMAVLYVAGLVVTGELSRDDLQAAKRVVA